MQKPYLCCDIMDVQDCIDDSIDNDVRLAHVICTYHREDLVRKKLELLFPLTSDNYHIFVIDNGETLDEQNAGGVTVIRSPNYGGSAGFARGMMFAVEQGFTHILLNDDDAELDPPSLIHTFEFLKHLMPDYYELCVCGTMLDFNNPNIVCESGVMIHNGVPRPLKKGVDITTPEGQLALSVYEHIDYGNWTYFCLPVSLIKKHGLPLPMFVREDDVEYGLRLGADIVTLPGVYVRHPTYTSSYRPVNYYYYARNRLVALCSSGNPDAYLLEKILDEAAAEAAAYRYQSCEQMIKGLEDFLKGPDYVYGLCRQGMHKAPGVAFGDPDELRKGLHLIDSAPEEEFDKRRKSLNGVFKSPAGDIEASPFDLDSAHFYRIGKVLYTTDNGESFVAERNKSKAISCAVKVTLLTRKARKMFPKLVKEYREARDKYTSFEFWKQMFEE